ncbi:hypothetical protein CEXT_381891 [Caerostris extrusa]|uniref:Uncharacterized protein n=1 Tax=Caerostris extrusa TaxID=172846 RepID=A0AAV4WE14_CAEEX|nr:hypothetical protein CEXT_381891 [Caerostris extrusa]
MASRAAMRRRGFEFISMPQILMRVTKTGDLIVQIFKHGLMESTSLFGKRAEELLVLHEICGKADELKPINARSRLSEFSEFQANGATLVIGQRSHENPRGTAVTKASADTRFQVRVPLFDARRPWYFYTVYIKNILKTSFQNLFAITRHANANRPKVCSVGHGSVWRTLCYNFRGLIESMKLRIPPNDVEWSFDDSTARFATYFFRTVKSTHSRIFLLKCLFHAAFLPRDQQTTLFRPIRKIMSPHPPLPSLAPAPFC